MAKYDIARTNHKSLNCSIIICTRNRANDLTKTLRSFKDLAIPKGLGTEVVVVDNASVDDTAGVVHAACLRDMDLRYVYEPKAGKCNAYNAGMAAARGEVLLFTDDDVRPASDWVERLATSLIRRECDAVVGKIEMAEHLRRPWIEPLHKIWLAAPDETCDWEPELIGANMGFHRSVLERVPGFDPELGPGALGFGDDTLFSFQLCEAGYRLRVVHDALVVHHFEPSRLLRSAWLDAAKKRGRAQAYLLHHWHHQELKNPRVRSGYFTTKLQSRRILQPPGPLGAEGCAPWEISYVSNIAMCRQFIQEGKRPRNYEKHGLIRLDFQPRTNAREMTSSWLR